MTNPNPFEPGNNGNDANQAPQFGQVPLPNAPQYAQNPNPQQPTDPAPTQFPQSGYSEASQQTPQYEYGHDQNTYGAAPQYGTAPQYEQPSYNAQTADPQYGPNQQYAGYGQQVPPAATPLPQGAPQYAGYAGGYAAAGQSPTNVPPLNKPYYGCPFPEAFLRFWKKYAVFKGRASRSEFWWWMLAAVIVNFVLGGLTSLNDNLSFLTTLWQLATIVPTIALGVRRLHDTNRPGWWIAIYYAALVVGAIVIVVGGGAAVVSLLGSASSYYGYGYGSSYGSAAAGGLGAMVIGILICLAAVIVYIVFMASASKPEGAHYDDDQTAQPYPPQQYDAAQYQAPSYPAYPTQAPQDQQPYQAPQDQPYQQYPDQQYPQYPQAQ